MKSESEFISGVYEKYEERRKKLEIRTKRITLMSRCAAVAACACFAVITVVRIVPYLDEKTADIAFDNAAPESVQMIASDANTSPRLSYSITNSEGETYEAPAIENAEEFEYSFKASMFVEDADASASAASGIAPTVSDENTETDKTEAAAAHTYTLAAENGVFTYTLAAELESENRDYGCEFTHDGVTVAKAIVNTDADINETDTTTLENGAVVGRCEAFDTDCSFVIYSTDTDIFVLVISDELRLSAHDVALSISYKING